MRLIVNIALVAFFGLILGGASAWYSLQRVHTIGGIKVGSWIASPFAGGADADPYVVAKISKDGTIPLGATEGLAFEALIDNQERPLKLECDYTISGTTPPSKLWTLTAYKQNGEPAGSVAGAIPAMQSGKILRFADGSFRISVSSKPRPGNWLPVSGSGEFYFILRVYDTPVTSTSGTVNPQMPTIIQQECSK